MQSIKFIYLKKIHKVPQNVTNFYNILETIKNSYKTLSNIYLFAIINPENPEVLTEINSDVTFQKLKIYYQQQRWPSIKLLVTETQNYQNALKESWNLLNQSILERKKDASTFLQPNNQDQWQQLTPIFENIGIQESVQQSDNAQNTNQFDFRNNEQLKQLINEILDQKLKELGLLSNLNEQINPSDYKLMLAMKIPIFTAIPNKDIKINLKLQNIGNKNWRNPSINNKKLKINQKFQDVAAGQYTQINISIPYIAEHFKDFEKYCYRFKIFVENEQGKLFKIDGQIPIKIKAPQKQELSPQEEKIFQLLELFPQKGEGVIKRFVEEHGRYRTGDELIELILQQNI